MDLDRKITMRCESCNRSYEINLKEVRAGTTKTCAGCGATTTFTNEHERQIAAELKKTLDALKSLKKLSR